jgi:NAD(P) transhydrogenase subunit alpha
MVSPFMVSLFVFVLACIVGYHVIWNVTPALHTPLMSVTNAISGIIVVGCILVVGTEGSPPVAKVIGTVGIAIASINIFGGFWVTQRMLSMYKKK